MRTGTDPTSPGAAEDDGGDYLFAPLVTETVFQYPGTLAPGSAFGSECRFLVFYFFGCAFGEWTGSVREARAPRESGSASAYAETGRSGRGNGESGASSRKATFRLSQEALGGVAGWCLMCLEAAHCCRRGRGRRR
jgi:hypothetical protein